MGNIGPMEILLIALVALLLFGAGRIADIGKGLGQGIKNFKQGLKDEEEPQKADALAKSSPAKPAQLPPAPPAKEDSGAKA